MEESRSTGSNAAGFRPGYMSTTGDFVVPTEDPYKRPYDPEPRVWEPANGRWSVTDRYVVLLNRIAEKVRATHPDVTLGGQAYSNKCLPPAQQPVPKDFSLGIAPIDFNRHHPLTWANHPNECWLRDIVQGWGKTGGSTREAPSATSRSSLPR